ncbi:MAG: phospho-N-acetylmuramoyl-pentapeptide-transferase [Verrucomicrobia bacterium RIFCSPLOWO2_12_FULL_64_8]|nr:MAG: phospho-N-acetylmuramoyl-pentapeptide-transferase [Verrucomicrobia bacterium RIFCSPLOWO2_12_FULL_64_8]
MLSYLSQFEDWYGPLRLLRFITLRTLMAAGTAAIIGFLIGPWLIAHLRALKFGHHYDDDRTGELAQRFDKKNVPTMGGLLIFAAVLVSTLLWARPNIWIAVCLLVYGGLTAVGFRDDYLKVVRRSRHGIRSLEKIIWQTLITIVALGLLMWHPGSSGRIAELWVPFVKEPVFRFVGFAGGAALFVLIFLWLVGFSNAINLTDGLDGLAIGCTITVALVYGIMAYAAGNVKIADYLLIGFVPGTGELAVICGALVGAGLAFLWYNSHPAEVFMGDTGSLALGGLLGMVAFMVQQPLTLVIVGGVFVMEAASVILQVGWFKATRHRYGEGRRLFLMAPIHHHFQKLGWPETKVVLRFWILSLICALAGLGTLKIR